MLGKEICNIHITKVHWPENSKKKLDKIYKQSIPVKENTNTRPKFEKCSTSLAIKKHKEKQ